MNDNEKIGIYKRISFWRKMDSVNVCSTAPNIYPHSLGSKPINIKILY